MTEVKLSVFQTAPPNNIGRGAAKIPRMQE